MNKPKILQIVGTIYFFMLYETMLKSPKVKELRKLTRASFTQCLECDVAFLNKRLVEEYFG